MWNVLSYSDLKEGSQDPEKKKGNFISPRQQNSEHLWDFTLSHGFVYSRIGKQFCIMGPAGPIDVYVNKSSHGTTYTLYIKCIFHFIGKVILTIFFWLIVPSTIHKTWGKPSAAFINKRHNEADHKRQIRTSCMFHVNIQADLKSRAGLM